MIQLIFKACKKRRYRNHSEEEKEKKRQNVLTKSKKEKNAKQISTFDFSTLYTKIPHDKKGT